jgi:hypothetical protein
MEPITALAILLGYGAKALTGAFQANRARKGLKALRNQPMPQFGITPEQTTSYNRAERLANTGFTGSERAAIGQNIAGASNLAYRRAMDIGGGSGARSIQGALNASGLNAYNRMGADDAALRRRNMQYADTVGRGITNQRNMETQRAFNYRMELERSLGAAKTQGIENIANAFGGVGAVAAYGGLDGLKGMKIPNFGRGGASPSGSNFAQPQGGYSAPSDPYNGGFNLPPSDLYNWPY